MCINCFEVCLISVLYSIYNRSRNFRLHSSSSGGTTRQPIQTHHCNTIQKNPTPIEADTTRNLRHISKHQCSKGNTSIFSKFLTLHFLIKRIPSSNSRDMISIPKHVSHRHSNAERNADIKKDLTADFSYDGGQIADLIGPRCAGWSRVFRPVDYWVLGC